MAYMFSTKKKQMELTIRTPYRIIILMQKQLLRVLPDSAELSPKLNNQPSSFKIEHHLLFTFSPQDTWDSNWLKKQRDSVINTCTPEDGLSSTRTNCNNCSDNTCEINLIDIADKKDVKPDQIDKVDIKDPDNLVGKYISKSRKMVSKTFAKRALQWSLLH